MNEHEGAWSRILELAVLVNDDMDRSLADLGLTRSRTHVLWVLAQQGSTTHAGLAAAIGVTAQNITGLVDALVGAGFVARSRHPTDRRATLVVLTERGSAVTDTMARQQRDLIQQLFGSMDPRQFRAFSAGLDVVLDTVRRLTSDASAAAHATASVGT